MRLVETPQIDLDDAYRLRVEIQAIVDTNTRSVLTLSAIVDELERRHPDLPPGIAEHLVKRVMEHAGAPGLDYAEAPLAAWSVVIRDWYPVRPDGRLERVPPADLSDAEMGAIQAELNLQAEWLSGQADALDAFAAKRATGDA